MKILFVCLGNICRSPLAEGILREKVKNQHLDWKIDSAGTGSWHIGEAPDPRSQAKAREYGLDISDLRGRQFSKLDFDDYDLIITMDRSNYKNVLALADDGIDQNKVKMMLSFNPDPIEEVPDPYWDDDGFEQVYQLLDKATDELIKQYQ